MSITIYVHNNNEDRAATIEEIETLFMNCYKEGTGLADIDLKLSNGCASDPAAQGFSIEIRP